MAKGHPKALAAPPGISGSLAERGLIEMPSALAPKSELTPVRAKTTTEGPGYMPLARTCRSFGPRRVRPALVGNRPSSALAEAEHVRLRVLPLGGVGERKHFYSINITTPSCNLRTN